jgi:uncharacterized membrane protein YfcA
LDASILDPYILALVAGGFFAALVVGAAGFGDALIAAAFWLHIMVPGEAVPLIVMAGIAIHGIPFIRLYRSLDYSRLWVFLLPGLFGVPIGIALLTILPAEPFKITVGAILIAYSLFRLAARNLDHVKGGGRRADLMIGGIGGVLGGLAGLSGIVVTIWCNLRGWSKAEQRGVFQPFALAMHGTAFTLFLFTGSVTSVVALNFLYILPAIVLGSMAGLLIYGKLNEQWFTRTVLLMLLGSGLMLLV